MLYAADDRYVLKEEMKQAVQDNQCAELAADVEWLETLAQARRLSVDDRLRLDYLKRKKNEDCR